MVSGAVKKSKSALFLIELIIAILFFALSSAICIQLFAKAHLISQRSSDTTMAVLQAQTAAEKWRGADRGSDALALTSHALAYYDGEWNAVFAAEEAVYEVAITESAEKNGVVQAQIGVRRVGAQEPLYELKTGVYTKK